MGNSERSAVISAVDWKERRDSIDEIARRLDELLRDMADVPSPPEDWAAANDGVLEAARRVWRARRERDRIFGATLAADPAWDILLDLFIAAGEDREVNVGSSSANTGIPEATVLRCIAHLAEAKLVARQARPSGDATIHLALTDQAISMISEFLVRTMREWGAAAA